MTKYILAGGYMHKAPDGGKSFCDEISKTIIGQPIRILDCLFGRDREDWNQRFQDDKNFFEKNIPLVSNELAQPDQFIKQIKQSDVIFFQGGVPRKIIDVLPPIDELVSVLAGKIIVGSSGGADVLCKYYGVGKTMNVREGLGLVPVKFIPHWKSDYAAGITINWDQLFQDLKNYGEDLEIVTLGEGEFKIF